MGSMYPTLRSKMSKLDCDKNVWPLPFWHFLCLSLSQSLDLLSRLSQPRVKMSSPDLYRRLLFWIATSLLIASIGTLGLTSHTKWLLAQHFPAGAWYIWREQGDLYKEQQTRQQWIAVDYNETIDRLALVRALLGVAAGVLGIWALQVKRRSVVEEETQVLFFSASLPYILLTNHSEFPLLLSE
jgi:hypothetical protein